MIKIVVCIRRGLDGEINPFDACAYEAALQIEDAEITLLSMGPRDVEQTLHALTRLGAKKAILLCDKAFAGADTLATAYALSMAIKKLSPGLVLCGRQTLVGDTAQTGAMLATMLGYGLITNVMRFESMTETNIICQTREEGEATVSLPALLTIERINTLRLPRLRSKLGEIEIWSAADIGADTARCGLAGSPTRVLKTFENQSGKRRCQFISRAELEDAIEAGLKKSLTVQAPQAISTHKLTRVFTVGDAPLAFARTVSDDITVLPLTDADTIASIIREKNPSVLLWGSDTRSKRIAAEIAAKCNLGLCADCTSLEAEEDTLLMYRPALSGSIIAKIKSLTRPAMATVRTDSGGVKDIIVGAGFGVRDRLDEVCKFAEDHNAALAATRKMTDNGYTPYEWQVGLTGKAVAPPVYIAIGISGAVHHIVGMQRAGTVIAINPDKNAPIFDYADYGIVDEF